jgi:hypothetical protein
MRSRLIGERVEEHGSSHAIEQAAEIARGLMAGRRARGEDLWPPTSAGWLETPQLLDQVVGDHAR